MGIILLERSALDSASAHASSGWKSCMSKTYCKYPAIIGIILAIILTLTAIYCAFRCLSCFCCDCLSGGRYQRKSHKHKSYKYADLYSSPYAGYQSQPPPVYGREQQYPPPTYAHFETSSRGADSLPQMPVWKEGSEKRVFHEDDVRADEKEMGKLERESLPMLASAKQSHRDPVPGYAEMDGGDLGQGSYKPYTPLSQSYRPYEAGAWGAGQHQAQEESGKGWRNV